MFQNLSLSIIKYDVWQSKSDTGYVDIAVCGTQSNDQNVLTAPGEKIEEDRRRCGQI